MIKMGKLGNSLAVRGLGLSAFTTRARVHPGRGTKILQAAWHSQKKKRKRDGETEAQKNTNGRSIRVKEVCTCIPGSVKEMSLKLMPCVPQGGPRALGEGGVAAGSASSQPSPARPPTVS